MDKRFVRRKTGPPPHSPTIDLGEPRVNDTAHRLYLSAIEEAREERRRQQRNGRPTVMQRQTLATKKKKKPLTIADIDRLFEEKRQREPRIRADLMDLYQKSTHRIRSLLDIQQIDQFVQITQHRLAISDEKRI